MLVAYRLPAFIDYLREHYNHLYRIYEGRLTELFPSSNADDQTLQVMEDDSISPGYTEQLMQLWRKFLG